MYIQRHYKNNLGRPTSFQYERLCTALMKCHILVKAGAEMNDCVWTTNHKHNLYKNYKPKTYLREMMVHFDAAD